jgi:hypothetical protein
MVKKTPAWYRGVNDYEMGVQLSANPYEVEAAFRRTTKAAQDWREGWMAAQWNHEDSPEVGDHPVSDGGE